MYYAQPFWPNVAEPTWVFTIDCFQDGDWVALLAGYKTTGDEIVGSFADFSNLALHPALYTGPTSICKQR
jgi:hypothetical protein